MVLNHWLVYHLKVTTTKYFMVTNDLWKKNCRGKNHLCLFCFENRLKSNLIYGNLKKWFDKEKVKKQPTALLNH
jgi:hypothetical protein